MSRFILGSIITVVIIFIGVPVMAQLTVTTNNNPTQLAQKILGKGITVLNAQFKGAAGSAGTFKAVPGSFLIDSGIVLTSGYAKTNGSDIGVNASANTQASEGPSPNFTDDDLYNYANPSGTTFPTNNACVLEFDFIPQGDSVYIRYIFGSEEYPEFNCSEFNDVFAFFISGPGYLTKRNIATVPGAPTITPVTINSVNNGVPAGPITNCQAWPGAPFTQFYVTNTSQHVVYDGHTVILTAKAKVTPCQTYHIKLGIADISDQGWDSGVFIEANSFTSKKEIDTEEQGPYTDPQNNNSVTMIEACKTAQVKLKRAEGVTGPFTLVRTYAGTATPGIDFTTDMPASVSFTATENEKIYNFSAPADALNEGLEKLVVRFSKGTCTTYFVDSAILYIRDSLIYRSKFDTSLCSSTPITLTARNPEPSVSNSYLWSQGSTTQSISVNQAGMYIARHIYSERCVNLDSFNVVSNDPSWTFNNADVSLCPGDTATLSLTTDANTITWNTGATTNSIKVSSAGQYWVTGTNAKCAKTDTVNVILKPAPVKSLGNDTGFCQNKTLDLDATYPGASYQWSNGATTPTITVSAAGQYSVINTLDGCVAKDTINITVNPIPAVYLGNDTSFCQGGSIQLNATYAGATNQWSTGATSQTIVVSATGQYSVINNMNGCVATDTINITAQPLPELELGADRSVCEQDTIHLNAFYPGATYAWNNGATTAGIVASNAGKYTVVSTVNGCSATDSMTLAVKPIPFADLGDDTSICQNKSVVLDATFPGGTTYAWNTGASSATLTVNTAGRYIVVNSLNGCSATDTIDVDTTPIPVLELGADRSICEQDTIHLDATFPGASYSWSNGATTATIIAGASGKYTVISTLNGCSATDSMTLAVNPVPVVDLGADTSFCENKSIVLNATFPGATNYSWNTGANTATLTVNTAGRYIVVNTLNGCSDTDTIDVSTKPIPVFDLGADRSICDKESVQLNATYPGATYSWSNGATTAVITVTTTGKYIATTTMNNCSTVDSVNVLVKPIPVVELGGDTSICENTSLILDASFPGGTTHTWSNGAGTSSIVVSTAGEYHVLNSLNGCTASDTINVATKSAPQLDLGADTSICSYDEMILDAYYPGATYLWNNGDDSASIIVTSAGKYSVISTLSGCPAKDTIIVSARKMPVVNAGLDMVVPQNTTAQLGTSPHSNNATYLWSPAGTLNNPSIANPIATPTAPVTEYTVYVVSVDGCVDEDKVTVRVVYPIRIPNAFSPNGDGINDTWKIANIELYPKSRVYIFNRYGQQIYNQGGFAGAWDGSYKGKTLQPATYYYVIDIGDGQRHTGYVVLLR